MKKAGLCYKISEHCRKGGGRWALQVMVSNSLVLFGLARFLINYSKMSRKDFCKSSLASEQLTICQLDYYFDYIVTILSRKSKDFKRRLLKI